MKKNNFLLAFVFAVCIFPSCGGNLHATTDKNNADSVTTQVNQDIETDKSVKKIAFEILVDSGTIELAAGEEGSPMASFKEEILVVTEVPSQTNLETIQAILQKKQEYSGDAKQALAQKKKKYLEGYVEMNSEEVMGMSAEWERDLSTQVIYNDNYFTTIGFYLDEYGGGARSYFSDSYLVLDLKNSKQITLSDIFDENGISQLTKKLTDKAKEMAQKEGSSSMEDYGFLVEEITPTERFIVTDKGIEFTYLRTEIVIGSMPSPSFFMSWVELKDIVKNDSPIRSLIL